MNLNSDWSSFPDDLEPIAGSTGPFPHRPFLETMWHHRDDRSSQLHIEASGSGAAAVVKSDNIVRFAGQSNLTDYHSPIGQDGPNSVAAALQRFPSTSFSLDSLPIEAVEPIIGALEGVDVHASVSKSETAAVLPLPATYDDWLASLTKKQRHEVRRKRRRFEDEFGTIEMVRNTRDAIDVFCAMHRLSAGEKGQFMTKPMEEFFADLLESAGASIHLLTCDGIARAAAFGFETDTGYFYYNSAYDPAAAMTSPGIVLFSTMIETEIKRGASVFDFLKGDEPYKFRHGAIARDLFTITGRTS